MRTARRRPGIDKMAVTARLEHGVATDDVRQERGSMPLIGTVKWFDSKKGYGFIEPGDGGRDVFVHFGDIAGEGYRSLEQGDKVQYEVIETPRGPKAAQVRKREP